MGLEGFQKELEEAEIHKVNKIKDKDLPLHSVDEFEFPVAKTQFTERLKTGEPLIDISSLKSEEVKQLLEKRLKGNKHA
jgi:hypothetical protein